jgi:hypothetical protein
MMAMMSPLLRVTTMTTTSTARMATSPTTTTNMPFALTVSTSPLMRATTSVVLSALPPHERALRVSGRACPHAESIILSAGGAESMILSARAESIILSVLPAESMILSQCCRHMSVPWESARKCALTVRASYSQQAVLRV